MSDLSGDPAQSGKSGEPQEPGESVKRTVFLLAHTGRPAAIRSAELVVQGLLRSGLGVRVLRHEAVDLPLPPEVELVAESECTPEVLDGCELLIVLGGDGTLLRGAEFARGSGCRCSASTWAGWASSRRRNGTTWTRSWTGS